MNLRREAMLMLEKRGAVLATAQKVSRILEEADIKLRSGVGNVLRSQDIADVIGLIRARDLGHSFARTVDRSVRTEFKKLVDAVGKE